MVKVAPEDQFIVYSRLPIPEGTLTPARNLTIQNVPGENDRIWSMRSLPEAARTNGADILHVQYSVPPRCHCPVVSTIHDISFRLHPNWFPLKHRLLLNLSTPIALRKAARVITVSHSSLKDMKAVYGRLAERVRAVPNGVGKEFLGTSPTPSERARSKQIVASKLGIDVPFVLAVGVSSLSKREKIRRKPLSLRKSRSTSLRRLYISRSYCQGETRVHRGGTTGMKPRSSASWRVSLPS